MIDKIILFTFGVVFVVVGLFQAFLSRRLLRIADNALQQYPGWLVRIARISAAGMRVDGPLIVVMYSIFGVLIMAVGAGIMYIAVTGTR